MPWPRAAPPARNETNEAASPRTRVTPPKTAALAARTSGLFGTASSVARIRPEVYSLLMPSTPSTPVTSSPGISPASALFVRSPAAFRVFSPMTTAMATAPATVIATVHQVDRSVRSLCHSIAVTCLNR